MIAWAIETLMASTLLMLVVLAIRTPVRRAFGPGIAYALWALPALRMALPPLPNAWRAQALPELAMPPEIAVYFAEPAMLLPAEPANGFGWPTIAMALWAAGSLGFIGYHLIAHRHFCARVRRSARTTQIVAAGKVAVIETDVAMGPLAFGILRKYVAFPRDFAERYDPLERDLALAHELGHHARGDLIANWVALLVLAIHWFNPIAWRAFRAFRADQEMACDALVLAGRAAELRHAYGRAIVKSAHGGAVSAACHLHTVNEIKGRLRMLSKHERTSRRRLAGGLVTVAGLAVAGLGATASGTQAAEHVRSTVETATGVDIASLELPELPQTPAVSAPPAPPPLATAKAPAASGAKSDEKGVKRVYIVRRSEGGEIEQIVDDAGAGKKPGHPKTFVFHHDDGALRVRRVEMMPVPPMPPMPPEALTALKTMPAVSSRDCGDDEGRPGASVIERKDGQKRIIIVCRNRIERVAANAATAAKFAEMRARMASSHALHSLKNARVNIERNANMTAEQRSSVLAGIDQAIRQMESAKAQ